MEKMLLLCFLIILFSYLHPRVTMNPMSQRNQNKDKLRRDRKKDNPGRRLRLWQYGGIRPSQRACSNPKDIKDVCVG